MIFNIFKIKLPLSNFTTFNLCSHFRMIQVVQSTFSSMFDIQLIYSLLEMVAVAYVVTKVILHNSCVLKIDFKTSKIHTIYKFYNIS